VSNGEDPRFGIRFAIDDFIAMSTGAIVLAVVLSGLSLAGVGCRSATEPRQSALADANVRANAGRSVGTASRVVAIALAHIGVPYRWGGADPRGFDCSGFVMYVYGQAGVALPHGAVRQYDIGVPVRRQHLEPGDIVFFDRLNHSGIYVGDGRFVHASKSGDVVKVSRLDEDWFDRRWVGARRLAIGDR
jgi:cell wall-associated NlpC family hydrolase